MKRRIQILLAVLALGVLGTLAVALHPAVLPDTATDMALHAEQLLLDNEGHTLGEKIEPLDVHYTINITAPAGQTRYIGNIKPTAFDLLQEEAWEIHLYTKDGKLIVETTRPHLHAKNRLSLVRYSAMAEIIPNPGLEKQPDGSYHPVYGVNFTLSATVQPSFWGKSIQTQALQLLKVDPVAGSVDAEEPRVSLEALIGKRTALSIRYPVKGLPSRYGDTGKEVALKSILHNLGKIDNKILAVKAALVIPKAAQEMLTRHTEADKAWPECWGEAAPVAKLCAKQIVPTLIYLQDNSCFGSKELADFINSPTFARFFGENFADKIPDALDAPIESFPIEKVSDL